MTADASLQLATPGTVHAFGAPRFADRDLADLAARDGDGAAWLAAFERHGIKAAEAAHGSFAVALIDRSGRTYAAVDRFSICTLCFRADGDALAVSPRADALADRGGALDPQAIFDYLYFHVIPAPRTIFRGVQRLAAGHYALLERGRLTVAPWWKPAFDEHRERPFAELRDEFRTILRDAVARNVGGASVGCFLSGGTDSSTLAGMLGEVTGKPAQTFSIGFAVDGYDEMEYARIAARHFNTDHHEYYVTPDDLVAAIPQVARSYDQPFGNSSVLPSYYCAKVARDAGVERILGGDGGDELFGGNSRYAKQKIFAAYDLVPGPIRRGLMEPLLMRTPLARIPVAKKGASYVEQARVPMPDRMQMYNLLARLGIAEVLTPEFLSSVDIHEPLRLQREVYATTAGDALVNRMLAFDWRFTLADNDLPKVIGATHLAGLSVGFPLLDDALTDFSLHLAPKLKLRGLQLRWFFKEALRGFLPDAILTKKKHGFGLPFGAWANTHPELKALALASLESLRHRGIVREAFLRDLVAIHLPRHPEYYGEMVWILMMLEQWLGASPASLATMPGAGGGLAQSTSR